MVSRRDVCEHWIGRAKKALNHRRDQCQSHREEIIKFNRLSTKSVMRKKFHRDRCKIISMISYSGLNYRDEICRNLLINCNFCEAFSFVARHMGLNVVIKSVRAYETYIDECKSETHAMFEGRRDFFYPEMFMAYHDAACIIRYAVDLFEEDPDYFIIITESSPR